MRLCNPNRLGDNMPVTLVHCSLKSIKNESSCNWMIDSDGEGGKVNKKVHTAQNFLQLEHAGDYGTGPVLSPSRC